MRVLVAPQEFKGTLTAAQAAEAIAAGVRDAAVAATVDVLPMSDGGPGIVDALITARGGERRRASAHDPLMRPIEATWGILSDGVAVIEMAAASGLVLVEKERRNPLTATTYGTGELLRAALDAGCPEIILGSGGSATVDGGAGALQALGVRFLDQDGHELQRGGAELAHLSRVDERVLDKRLAKTRLRIACDVTNVLCGPHGAAMMYAAQKGATPYAARQLDSALGRFAEVLRQQFGTAIATVPGSGSAGGLGAGLAVLAGARLEPGFPLIAEATRLSERIAAADLVITGEGRLDVQTHYGKTVAGVAGAAREQGKPVGVVAGTIEAGYDASRDGFAAIEAVVRARAFPYAAQTPEGDPADAVREASERLARRLLEHALAV